MTPPDRELIERFRDAVAARFGLQFDDGKRDYLGDVLTRHVARGGIADPVAAVARLVSGRLSRSETESLVDDLTVGETYLFRHPDQFRAFTDAVLLARPPLPGTCRRVHVLSAGCASGEEAYSLAMVTHDHIPEAAGWDVRVVGIDLNPAALARAVRGQYTAWSLRGTPDDLRRRYFRTVNREEWLVESVRTVVSFEERNLLDDAPDFWRPAAFDVIFCRNVLMYFTPDAARAVVARLTRSLVPGGFLFLGPAETLRGVSNDYHLRHTHDTFYYQRRLPGEGPFPQDLGLRPPRAEGFNPAAAAVDDSWVTAIADASERIARLGNELRQPPKPYSRREPEPTRPATPSGVGTAHEMIRQERYADALQALGPPAKGRNPDAQLLRAVVLTNCGNVAEAERLCHEVLAGDELSAEARYLLALCREHAGEYAGAAEQARIAVYLDPRFAMPHLHLGLLCKRAGDWDGTRRAFRDASALLPAEDTARVLLFGGGFSREALLRLCEAELRACGDRA